MSPATVGAVSSAGLDSVTLSETVSDVAENAVLPPAAEASYVVP
jgi:hypothetical protein